MLPRGRVNWRVLHTGGTRPCCLRIFPFRLDKVPTSDNISLGFRAERECQSASGHFQKFQSGNLSESIAPSHAQHTLPANHRSGILPLNGELRASAYYRMPVFSLLLTGGTPRRRAFYGLIATPSACRQL